MLGHLISIASHHNFLPVNVETCADINVVQSELSDCSLQQNSPHADVEELEAVVARIKVKIELPRRFCGLIVARKSVKVVVAILRVKLYYFSQLIAC